MNEIFKKNNLNNAALHLAIENEKIDIVGLLISDQRTDVNLKNILNFYFFYKILYFQI